MTVRPVGLYAVGVSAPAFRLPASEARAAWGEGGGRGQVAVCGADEDTLTLGWEAGDRALSASGTGASGLEVDGHGVDGLWWGTSRPPFAEGPSHSFLAAALGIGPTASGGLNSGSPHAGMEALCGAWDAIAAGHAERGSRHRLRRAPTWSRDGF